MQLKIHPPCSLRVSLSSYSSSLPWGHLLELAYPPIKPMDVCVCEANLSLDKGPCAVDFTTLKQTWKLENFLGSWAQSFSLANVTGRHPGVWYPVLNTSTEMISSFLRVSPLALLNFSMVLNYFAI